jgi:hypothetical protein
MRTRLLASANPARLGGGLAMLCRRLALATLHVTLLTVALPAAAQERQDELGRLFFTPERRQALDRQRQLNIQEKQEIPEDPTLTINGLVTRSSGKRSTWINGVLQNENEMPTGVTVTPNRREPGKIVVKTTDTPPAPARVGETVNRNTGEAVDLLKGGSISVLRGPSAKANPDR